MGPACQAPCSLPVHPSIQHFDWDALGAHSNLTCVMLLRSALCLWERQPALDACDPNSVSRLIPQRTATRLCSRHTAHACICYYLGRVLVGAASNAVPRHSTHSTHAMQCVCGGWVLRKNQTFVQFSGLHIASRFVQSPIELHTMQPVSLSDGIADPPCFAPTWKALPHP